MNRDRLLGYYKQALGRARQYWGRLVRSEPATAAGIEQRRAGRVQSRYGRALDRLARRRKARECAVAAM